jgi:pimeloyl-ACP methyl ester carboxylesterase
MQDAAIPSRDGTPIALRRSGAGPVLLLVHGSGTGGAQFAALRPLLEPRFTVAAMDRRGHGASGDGAAYALAREAEDIAAVLDALGGGYVLAHSYGAICALEAARHGARIGRLALYEPPIVTAPGAYFPPNLIPAMRAAIAAGDGGVAIEAFARIVRGATEAQVAQMRRMPGWAERAARAPVLLRELEAVDRYRLDPAAFADWRVPTLLLRGAASGPDYVATATALRAALPGSRLELLPGQGHGAIEAAPAVVAAALQAFLSRSEAPPDPAA